MGTHRYIATSFWDDEWVQTLDPSEKLLFMYLMSSPLSNLAGVYKITYKRMCFDTGFNNDTISHIMEKFKKAGKVYRIGEYIALPNCPKHQNIAAVGIRKGIISILQDLPEDVFLQLEEIGYCFDLSTVASTIISRKARKTISGTVQKAVYEKCGYQCTGCGAKDNLNIHHIVAVQDGGNNKIENLTLLCEDCHVKIHYPQLDRGFHTSTVESTEFNLNSNLNLNEFNINSSGIAGREAEAAPPADNPEPSPKPKKSKKPPLREREPENDTERVEKAYIQNWDTLYAEKRVQTPDPVVTWSQTRALLKAHFEKLKPEQIIQAINNGLRDDWILKGGYSLATMLSASVLNRLINAVASGRSPPGLNKKKSLEGLDSW